MQKVEYSITKNEATKEWILWKSVTDFQEKKGIGSLKGIFSGTKKECQEKKREMMKNDKRRRNKNVKKR